MILIVRLMESWLAIVSEPSSGLLRWRTSASNSTCAAVALRLGCLEADRACGDGARNGGLRKAVCRGRGFVRVAEEALLGTRGGSVRTREGSRGSHADHLIAVTLPITAAQVGRDIGMCHVGSLCPRPPAKDGLHA